MKDGTYSCLHKSLLLILLGERKKLRITSLYLLATKEAAVPPTILPTQRPPQYPKAPVTGFPNVQPNVRPTFFPIQPPTIEPPESAILSNFYLIHN